MNSETLYHLYSPSHGYFAGFDRWPSSLFSVPLFTNDPRTAMFCRPNKLMELIVPELPKDVELVEIY